MSRKNGAGLLHPPLLLVPGAHANKPVDAPEAIDNAGAESDAIGRRMVFLLMFATQAVLLAGLHASGKWTQAPLLI